MPNLTKNLIFVHGAWHNSTCWTSLLQYIDKKKYNVVLIDLSFENCQNPIKTTLKNYRDVVIENIDSCHGEVVLVGHSMGGVVISQVAEVMPDKIDSLCFISAYLLKDQESVFISCMQDKLSLLPTKELIIEKGRILMTEAIATKVFYNKCSEVQQQIAVSALQKQAILPLSNKVKLSQKKFGSVKKKYIFCTKDNCISFNHQQTMTQHWDIKDTVELDSDHSPFISQPSSLALHLNNL